MTGQAIVVTGVSTGIGNGILRELCKAGYRVFGSVRKPEDARRLSNELGSTFTPLVFDVTDAAAVAEGVKAVRAALGKEKLAGLVNNAGIAVPGPLLELPVSEFRRQIEVNLVSVLSVTQAFFPLLRTAVDPGGAAARIVNISSIAGQFALPFLGPYAASKHGVEGLSDSLRRECMLFGVDVIVIDPGSVATPIWNKSKPDFNAMSRSPYLEAMTRAANAMLAQGAKGMPPEKIGQLVVNIYAAKKPRARYVIGGQKLMLWLSRNLLGPRRMDRIIARRMGLKPPGLKPPGLKPG